MTSQWLLQLFFSAFLTWTVIFSGSQVAPDKSTMCCPSGMETCSNKTDQQKIPFPGFFRKEKFFTEMKIENLGIPNNKTRTVIGNVDSDIMNGNRSTRTKRQAGCDCCETLHVFAIYEEVQFQDQTYEVVHYEENDMYQVVTEGICISDSCSNVNCIQKYTFSWVLVKNGSEQVFINVLFPSICECN